MQALTPPKNQQKTNKQTNKTKQKTKQKHFIFDRNIWYISALKQTTNIK